MEKLWLKFVFYGLPGSLNVLNVLNKSVTMVTILGSNFLPRMTCKTNGTTRSLLYFLGTGYTRPMHYF